MLVKEQIRLLIPMMITYNSKRDSEEIQNWLLYVTRDYRKEAFDIAFLNERDRILFLLKYAGYVI